MRAAALKASTAVFQRCGSSMLIMRDCQQLQVVPVII